MTDSRPPRGLFRVNGHGVLGACCIATAAAIVVARNWNVTWIYFTVAAVAYAGALMISSRELRNIEQRQPYSDHAEHIELHHRELRIPYFQAMRRLYCAHLSFVFLTAGLLISYSDYWLSVAIFIAAVACGCALPFLLFRMNPGEERTPRR